MARSLCGSCGSRSLMHDDTTGNLLCANCGTVVRNSTFEAQLGGINGPTGTYIHIGTSGVGSVLPYKEKIIFEANKVINDLSLQLQLSRSIQDKVKDMVVRVTEGDYGQGEWFPVLVAACACIVMRRNNESLPMAQAASVIGHSTYELGRMITRVVDFLELKREEEFPVYNIATTFDRAMREFCNFRKLSIDDMKRLHKQGMFLIQCAIKWFLTTGRRPLPVVVAVLIFVAELNKIEVKIADMAREFCVAVSTTKNRYNELLEALVKVSRALPWGKDVTVKNIMKHAPFVIQYMEKKSMLKGKCGDAHEFDLVDVVSGCFSKSSVYMAEGMGASERDSAYFEIEDRSRSGRLGVDDMKISPECLSLVYSKFLEEKGSVSGNDGGNRKRRKTSKDIDLYSCSEWWQGKSDLSRKLILEQILEKNVGMEQMPPSFVAGILANKKRRERINAAKQRISNIMSANNLSVRDAGGFQPANAVPAKKRRRTKVEVDWEDFIIETLLLHRVKEEEIEKGHYNTLLDLYVFNDPAPCK